MNEKLLGHFDNKTTLKLIESLLLIRLVEEEICNRYGKPGENQPMRCPVHLSIGQEAVAVGVCANLSNKDKIFSNHRCHAHYLAKGGNLSLMINEIYGKLGGCIDGRGGSMHLMDNEAGVLMSIPIVASAIPLATGAALKNKIDKTNNVVVVFFGDGAVEEGVFHESLNFASLNSLPIVFVCENNLFSVYTHLDDRQPSRPLTNLSEAHKINSHHIQDLDVFSINRKFSHIIEKTRLDSSPNFVLIDTYRWREHCGVNFDDNLGYRDQIEVKKWMKNDPVAISCDLALESQLIESKDIDNIKNKLDEKIKNIFTDAEVKPLPSPEMAEKFVYWSKS